MDSTGDVMAFDLLRRRLIRYRNDGRPSAQATVNLPNGFMWSSIAAGSLLVAATDPSRQSGDSAGVSIFVLDSTEFRRRATLPVKERDFGIDDLRPVPDAYGPVPLWAMLADGSVLHSSAAEHEIDLFSTSGQLLRRFGATVSRREINSTDLDELVAKRLRGVTDARMRAAVRNRMTLPASGQHPALTRMVALVTGEVWVRESHRAAGDSVSWVVYRVADGAALGKLVLGIDDDILASVGDSLLFYRADDPRGDAAVQWITIRRRN